MNATDNTYYNIGVVGLGYVGLPLAMMFATRYDVVGYDVNAERVQALREGRDATGTASSDELLSAQRGRLRFSSDANAVRNCNTFIVAVPTPVDTYNRPDLTPLLSACTTVGGLLKTGDLVVFESTVYPGVTEEECVPELERVSGLRYNVDFVVGYSPERINPGDTLHTVENICKVTSGSNEEAVCRVDNLYASVLKGGIFRASSIKVAEASKIIENTQRDVNIAFMNEVARIFNAMGIDTRDVLEAASTKWNFVRMQPGLVGGHCIGVDPYYLIQKAQVYGILPRVMTNARRLNDSMGAYVAQQVVRQMNIKGLMVKGANVLILGFAFKANCPDIRNTKVVDVLRTLSDYDMHIDIYDPVVDPILVERDYAIRLLPALHSGTNYDAVILAVGHQELCTLDVRGLVREGGVIYDVPAALPRAIVDARL
ncbi:MAG: nucleotide sugar dehydrogenase [Bacteroidales bacterium]|nr:nucleotide sugar dehydrogenase [Bacteroidales bacterium]